MYSLLLVLVGLGLLDLAVLVVTFVILLPLAIAFGWRSTGFTVEIRPVW